MKLIPYFIYLLSVVISRQFCASYWIVGPVFAIALLLINYQSLTKSSSQKYLVFVLASTLVYALVFLIASRGWSFKKDWQDALFGALSGGVILGSFLLPRIQARLFGLALKKSLKVSLLLIISWYAVTFLSLIEDPLLEIAPFIDFLSISIALWQGIYFKYLKLN